MGFVLFVQLYIFSLRHCPLKLMQGLGTNPYLYSLYNTWNWNSGKNRKRLGTFVTLMMSGEYEVVIGIHMRIVHWTSSLHIPPLGRISDVENT